MTITEVEYSPAGAVNLDLLDLAILDTVREQALWKKRLYEQLAQRAQIDRYLATVSLQTVARRVDKLRENGYLQSCIISPDDLNRDLIIAFRASEAGVTALTEYKICPDCGELVHESSHEHAFTPVKTYFKNS
ncbi:hypothetical protein [Halomontanus rarus]|uniref:hypothetical protein n=1 Tax=Halomontanus rarus TaxID=3034020 RepID=UPI001A999F96